VSASHHAACVSLPNLLRCQTAGTEAPKVSIRSPWARPEEAAYMGRRLARQHSFFAPSAVECLNSVPASILAQKNHLPKRSGSQIRAFRGTAYIASVRRKVQELFHQPGELFSGPASDARGRRLRKRRLIWTALLPVNTLFRLFCS